MTSINSPFRYPGGKFYARNIILKYLPAHSYYLEPFAGGGSIFFAKQKTPFNHLNDIDIELINCYLQIRDNVENLISLLKGVPATKEKHAYYKNDFNPQSDLERAVRWFYLNRTSYSGIMTKGNCYWGYGDEYSMRPENWPNHLRRCSAKLQEVELSCKDFEKVIEEAPNNSFLFIDPPYYKADQNKLYVHSFSLEDHQRLAKCLRKNQHRLKFLLTYDNVEEVRTLYQWADQIVEQEWNYTINRTDDQKKKTSNRGKRYRGKEIFILNYTDVSEVNIPEFSKSTNISSKEEHYLLTVI